MAVEAASKISDLNPTLPLFDDPIVEGDDHIRLLKSVVKLDAFSKAETAAQTVVSPLTLNGLVTGKVGFRAESALPYFELREDDTALPGGLFRLQSSAGALTLRANTAPAGDFSTGVNIINYAAGVLNFEAPVAFDILKVESTGPILSLVESDQAAPAGRYRLAVQGDVFVLQRALTGEFTTADNLLSYLPATGFTFHKTVAAPMRIGSIYVGGSPTGVATPIQISAATGNGLQLRSGIDTTAMVQFVNATGLEVARIEPAGTAASDPQTVITLEKGDFRYVDKVTSATQSILGALDAAAFRSGDQDFVGSPTVGGVDLQPAGFNIKVRNGLSGAGDVIAAYYNGAKTFNVSRGGGLVAVNGTFGSGNITVGAGAVNSIVSGTSLSLGSASGGIVQFTIGGVEAGRIVGAGSAIGTAATAVVTKEKGAVLYAPISSQRYKDAIVPQSRAVLLDAFDTLVPSAWTWGGELPADNERYGTTGVGFIAEDVEPVFPAAVCYEWVPTGDDTPATEKRVQGLDALALIAVLVEKIRAQDERIAALEAA